MPGRRASILIPSFAHKIRFPGVARGSNVPKSGTMTVGMVLCNAMSLGSMI